MLTTLARNWWMVLLQGIFAVLFGVLAVVLTGPTLATLILLFGAYALVDGVMVLLGALFGPPDGAAGAAGTPRWVRALQGLLGIIVGIVTFVWPQLTALTLLYVIAFWAIVTGIAEIVFAVQFRKEIPNEVSLIISGAASTIFGLLLILFPREGALSVIWLIGIFAIIYGVILIVFSLRLRGMGGAPRGPLRTGAA